MNSSVFSISEIMKRETPKRCLLQSTLSSGPTFFIPWFYWKPNNVWYGVERWIGNNNRHIGICTRQADTKMWKVIRRTFPILPKNHPVRLILEQKEKRFKRYIQ
jgi:hypothetical protein